MPNESNWGQYFAQYDQGQQALRQSLDDARERVRSVSFRNREGQQLPMESAGDFAPLEMAVSDTHFGRVIGVDTGRWEVASTTEVRSRRERIIHLEERISHLEQELEAVVPQVVDDGLTMLPRTGAKGQFVLYPKEWPPQWRDPRNRRFQTKCDMLAGPCSCGRRHLPEDSDVQENLTRYGCKIETMQQWRDRLYA